MIHIKSFPFHVIAEKYLAIAVIEIKQGSIIIRMKDTNRNEEPFFVFSLSMEYRVQIGSK